MPDRTAPGGAGSVIVVGAGPAGLACALRLGHAGVTVTLVEGNLPGGQLWEFADAGPVPGAEGPLTGDDLSARLQGQVADAGAGFESASAAGLLAVPGDGGPGRARGVVLADGRELRADAVVAATGTRRRPVETAAGPLDEALLTHCLPCDGPLLAGRDVALVGTGEPLGRDLAEARTFAACAYVVGRGATAPASAADAGAGARVVALDGHLRALAGGPGRFTLSVEVGGADLTVEVAALVPCVGFEPVADWLPPGLRGAAGWVDGPAPAPGVWAAGSLRRGLGDGGPADVMADGWYVAGLVLAALAADPAAVARP